MTHRLGLAEDLPAEGDEWHVCGVRVLVSWVQPARADGRRWVNGSVHGEDVVVDLLPAHGSAPASR